MADNTKRYDTVEDGVRQYAGMIPGYAIDFGYSAFNTTDTTQAIYTRLSKVLCAQITAVGSTFAAAENVYIGDTPNADGSITVSAGHIHAKRAAGTTSGLAFHYLLIGVD